MLIHLEKIVLDPHGSMQLYYVTLQNYVANDLQIMLE
jgi:hypothetical protein